ncbi:MAG: hypothetical protein F6J95_014575 [Leptolyngbya sp. SIO1E4]|nr:hypothetical protein [Leptolyngbya sp. SIO1E4]
MERITRSGIALCSVIVVCLGVPLLAYWLTHQGQRSNIEATQLKPLGTAFPTNLLFNQEHKFSFEASQTGRESRRLAHNRTNLLPVPPLPANLPEATPPGPEIVGALPTPSEDIGVGHLYPKDFSFLGGQDWMNSPYLTERWIQLIALPLYTNPEGNHWGWIVNGWLIPNGQAAIAIGHDTPFFMRFTFYALSSFLVTEIREDGWFQLQYTPTNTAWVHTDHLNLGSLELGVERWQDRFLDAGIIEFRHNEPQPLRSEPADDATAILTLNNESTWIEPLAFNGDWMHVRVWQIGDPASHPAPSPQVGWVRWRTADNQSLIWYPPKGA